MVMQVLKNSLESLYNVYPASQSKITCWYGTGPTSEMDSEPSQTLKLCVKIINDRESLCQCSSHIFGMCPVADLLTHFLARLSFYIP